MTAYDDIVLRDAPTNYIPFDDESGTTATALVGLDGTYSNSPTLGATGPVQMGSTGVSFDGVNDMVIMTSDGRVWDEPPFSMELWFKRDGVVSGSEWLYWQGVSSVTNPQFGFYLNTSWEGLVAVVMRENGGTVRINNVANTSGVLDNEWHHLVYTEDASRNGKLYIDGVEEATTGPYTPDETNISSRSRCGRRDGGTTDGEFEGDLAGFAAYDYELDPEQVVQHYNAGQRRNIMEARAEELGAVLHLPLDDYADAKAYASEGSDGTYSGSPTLQATGPSDYLPYGISTDGTDDHVLTPTINGLGASQAQSWEVWFDYSATINSATGSLAIVSEDSGSDVGAIFLGSATTHLTNEVITVFDEDTQNRRTGWTGLSIPTGWHHLVLTYTGTQNGWFAFLDGEDVTGSTWGGTKVDNDSGSNGLNDAEAWFLSRSSGGSYDAFDGLAAFTVYDFELTPQQVYENYRLGLDLGVGTSFSPIGY